MRNLFRNTAFPNNGVERCSLDRFGKLTLGKIAHLGSAWKNVFGKLPMTFQNGRDFREKDGKVSVFFPQIPRTLRLKKSILFCRNRLKVIAYKSSQSSPR